MKCTCMERREKGEERKGKAEPTKVGEMGRIKNESLKREH